MPGHPDIDPPCLATAGLGDPLVLNRVADHRAVRIQVVENLLQKTAVLRVGVVT